MILTDRSRIIKYQSCPRARFLNYHSRNTGITKSSVNIYTTTGSYTHRGVEYILKGEGLEQSVSRAILEYDEDNHNKQLDLDVSEDQDFVYREQRALIEALVRIYYKIQYPLILAEYEIVSVEEELLYPLVEPTYNTTIEGTNLDNNGILLMSKPDAVLRSKETDSLVVYSLKTASQWNETTQKSAKYDVQGISELVATEYKYQEEVEAIKMDYLIKGSRQLLGEKGNKKKLQNTFLVHPYMLDSGITTQFSLSSTRAKGWNRINIWEQLTIKDWVDYLVSEHQNQLIGGMDEDSQKVIVSPYPYQRSLTDIQNWIEQTQFQEQTINMHLDILRHRNSSLVGSRETQDVEYKSSLNRFFSQNRKECYTFGSWCPYTDICWEGLRTDSVEYTSRVPHHSTELINIEKGVKNGN